MLRWRLTRQAELRLSYLGAILGLSSLTTVLRLSNLGSLRDWLPGLTRLI